MNDDTARKSFLRTDEPAPYTVLNANSTVPLLLVCDHASNRMPRAVGNLGLDAATRACHLAVDIGAADVTRRLAASFRATTLLANYSRLVVDLNRHLSSPGAFLEYGDGVAIPGNRNLSAAARQARADTLYWPYHMAVADHVRRLSALEPQPLIVSMHSFTPAMDGVTRPWEVGVLWHEDRATAEALMAGFRAAGFVVGDNQPYSARMPLIFTLARHAEPAGLPHAIIELRQDLINHPAGVARLAGVLEHLLIDLLPAPLPHAAGEPSPQACRDRG